MLVEFPVACCCFRRQRDLEQGSIQDADVDTVFVEKFFGVADLFDGLRGVVLTPETADLGVLEAEALEESDGGAKVVVNFVGGDAELEVGELGGGKT